MSSLGTAIFDGALVAYPMYKTCEHILSTHDIMDLDEAVHSYQDSDRWLQFWMTFGMVELVQNAGADNIPGFHFAKAALLLSLYSVEHARLVGSLIPRFCRSYIGNMDRLRAWWYESAIPKVQDSVQNSWSDFARSSSSKLLRWWNSSSSKSGPEEEDKED